MKHIEQQVEELLYRKNEILRRATNGVDYSLSEATRLMRIQWLQYADRVKGIENQAIKAFPNLYAVNVNVDRTISKIEEMDLTPMLRPVWSSDGSYEWGSHRCHWSNELDALQGMLKFYRDDPAGLNERLNQDLVEPLPPYGFPNIYQMMQDLRYTCEHWDELAATRDENEPDEGFNLCQEVLTTLQSDLDTSLRQAEPEIAEVIAAVRRRRDKMHRRISQNWANEFKQKFLDNTVYRTRVPAMPELDDLIRVVNKNRYFWQTTYMRHTPEPFFRHIGQTIIEGLSELYNRLDEFKQEYIIDNPPIEAQKPAVDRIFGKNSSPIILKTFCEIMGGFDSKAACAIRQSWMKIAIENSTIGTEWDLEKICAVRSQFSKEEYEARLGKDLAVSFIEIFEDALEIAKHIDFLNPAGRRSWFSTWNTE